MNKLNRRKLFFVAAATLSLIAIGATQIKQVLKVLGVGAVVSQFGPEINKQINNLQGWKDTGAIKTKVVPILTVGVGTSSAVGAAQVMGPPSRVDQVVAVAQPEAELFGNEIRIRAMIPVSSQNVIENIKRVEGVGVSGIVDLRL